VAQAPSDAEMASLVARAYVEELIAGRYADAWTRLAPRSQALWGSVEPYARERAAFYRGAGPEYRLSAPDSSEAALAAWLPAGFDGDRLRASVLELEYVRISGPAGLSVLVVAPDATGSWRIWIAR
jgi:hypothetical protein